MPYGQWAAVGEETTYGTPVARNKFARIMPGSFLNHNVDRPVHGALKANVAGDAEKVFEAGQWGEGKLIVPAQYDDGLLLKLCKHGFGVLVTSGAGPYTHTFTRGGGPPFNAGAVANALSMSVELNYELPDAGPLESRLLEGAMVNMLTFGWVRGQAPQVEVDLIGEQVTQVIKTASPTFPDIDLYLQKFSQCAVAVDGGDISVRVEEVQLVIDNGYQTDFTLGSSVTRQPKRGPNAGGVSGVIKGRWATTPTPTAKALWDKMVANTAASIVLTITGPTNYSWVITLSDVRFTAGNMEPIEGHIQPFELPWNALWNATNTTVKLAAQNQTATV